MIKVIQDRRKWRVRIVRKGESYGLNNCLTHEYDDPLIEFWDLDASKEKFGEEGQFVSSYYLSTFRRIHGTGLDLYGGVAGWEINADTVTALQEWAGAALADSVAPRDIHKETAARMFGVPEDAVTPEQRRAGKRQNFCSMYSPFAEGKP